MASREELYTALRNADAAGDAEGAKKLATYIQSLPEDAPAPIAAQKSPDSSLKQNLLVGNNAINKGIAGGVDTLLNAPVNALNIGKALVGGIGHEYLGLPEKYMPELTPTPNLMQGAMRKVGMINEGAEPQTGAQRIIDTGGQFAGGAAINPAGSLRQAGVNVVKSGLAGLMSGGVKEATDSPAAGMAAGILAPIGLNSASNKMSDMAQKSIADLAAAKQAGSVRSGTLDAAREAGLVVPPTTVNPSNMNRILEGVAGKAATAQAASVKNQPVIDRIAREEAGLQPNEPITPEALARVRAVQAQPYNDLKQIGNLTLDAQYKNLSIAPQPFTGALGTQTIPAAKAVDAIKQLRADGNAYFKQYGRDANPETLLKAQQNTGAAMQLENLIERNLQAAGKTDLLQNFRDARTALAKNYQVENALREGGGSIDPRKIAQSTQQGAPLTGGLKTIGDFANNFPKAAAPLHQIGSPGVSKLEMGQAGAGGVAGGMLGGPIGGAAGAIGTLIVPPAIKAALLSPAYQKFMAQSKYTPSMMAGMLAKLPPNTPPDLALQAITSGRISVENANPSPRLSDMLRAQ